MSFLLDLLSRVKVRRERRQVSPQIERLYRSRNLSKRYAVILISLVFCSIITGAILLFIVNRFDLRHATDIPATETDYDTTRPDQADSKDVKVPGETETSQGIGTNRESGNPILVSREVPQEEKTNLSADSQDQPAGRQGLPQGDIPTKGITEGGLEPQAPVTAISSKERPEETEIPDKKDRKPQQTEVAKDWTEGSIDQVDAGSSTEHRTQSKNNIEREEGKNTEDIIKAEEQEKEEAIFYIYQAREFENQRRLDKAVRSYIRAFLLDPGNYKLSNKIAYLYIRLKNYNEAIRYSAKALSIKSDYVPAMINLSLAHSKKGDLKSAEKILRQVLSLEPDNVHAIYNLALLHETADQYVRAFDLYKRLSEMQRWEGLLGMARIKEKVGLKDKAIELYRRIINEDNVPENIKEKIKDRIIRLSEPH